MAIESKVTEEAKWKRNLLARNRLLREVFEMLDLHKETKTSYKSAIWNLSKWASFYHLGLYRRKGKLTPEELKTYCSLQKETNSKLLKLMESGRGLSEVPVIENFCLDLVCERISVDYRNRKFHLNVSSD